MGRRLAAALGLAALGIIWLTEFTDIDMLLARAAFDPALGDFPLRHAFLMETVGHRYVRNLCVLAGACVLGLVLVDLRFGVLDTWARIRMRALALCAVLVPLTVSLLKSASSLACPWDLQAFNGKQPYFRLFDAIPAGASAGHCWPGGHASGSLWLLGLVVFWLPYRPR
ncbi:MAG TPA: acid phosphatase, partial [Telluria sp.]